MNKLDFEKETVLTSDEFGSPEVALAAKARHEYLQATMTDKQREISVMAQREIEEVCDALNISNKTEDAARQFLFAIALKSGKSSGAILEQLRKMKSGDYVTETLDGSKAYFMTPQKRLHEAGDYVRGLERALIGMMNFKLHEMEKQKLPRKLKKALRKQLSYKLRNLGISISGESR